MNITKSTEVRTVNAVNIEADSHFFFDGIGHVRAERNDGQPDVLNARRSSATVSGRVTGIVKMVNITGAPDWFSLRSIGSKGSGLTVYVKGESLVVIDGKETTVRDLFNS